MIGWQCNPQYRRSGGNRRLWSIKPPIDASDIAEVGLDTMKQEAAQCGCSPI